MKNANNSQVYTAKAVAEVKKQVNTEYNSVFGAVKALVLCDALTHEGKQMLSAIAESKFSTSKEFRSLLASQVMENTQLYTIVDGKRLAVDVVTRTDSKGVKTKHFVLRTKWTAGKILDTYRVVVGSKEPKLIDQTLLLKE